MNGNEEERDALERRLAEQDLFRQALAARDEKVRELETEVKYLRRTLHEVLAAPRPALAGVPAPARAAPVPRRWRAAA